MVSGIRWGTDGLWGYVGYRWSLGLGGVQMVSGIKQDYVGVQMVSGIRQDQMGFRLSGIRWAQAIYSQIIFDATITCACVGQLRVWNQRYSVQDTSKRTPQPYAIGTRDDRPRRFPARTGGWRVGGGDNDTVRRRHLKIYILLLIFSFSCYIFYLLMITATSISYSRRYSIV